jgi:putative multiple sugar transport system substrate-binding protein
MAKKLMTILVCILVLGGFLGCNKKPAADQGSSKPVIGISMPTKEQPIWSAQGTRLVEAFEGAGYSTLLEYAEDVTERQILQLENMITRGAKYLIIAAVDTYSLTDICGKAKEAGIKVISSDRLIMNTNDVDYYVTFDLIRMGELQGEAIERGLKLKEGAAGPFTLEIFSGSPDDSNSVPFYEGAMSVLKKYLDNGTLVVRSGQVDLSVNGILKWDSAVAQARMDNILGAYYTNTKLDSVLAAADCLSLGIISSLDSFGYGKSQDIPFPIVTGQDCELTAVKSIMNDQQYMSVFIDQVVFAQKVLGLVNAMEAGTEIKPDRTFNNDVFEVPTILYDPVMIDKSNYTLLVERDFYTKEDLDL